MCDVTFLFMNLEITMVILVFKVVLREVGLFSTVSRQYLHVPHPVLSLRINFSTLKKFYQSFQNFQNFTCIATAHLSNNYLKCFLLLLFFFFGMKIYSVLFVSLNDLSPLVFYSNHQTKVANPVQVTLLRLIPPFAC